jgi:hypothetical protein
MGIKIKSSLHIGNAMVNFGICKVSRILYFKLLS